MALAVLAQPEPGPDDSGLRLRFVVLPHSDTNGEGYDVHVDIINVTNHDITLHAESEEGNRDIKGLLEAAINIETYPAIAPWLGQVVEFPHSRPQVESVLKSGDKLSMEWHTTGRHLKNSVSNPLVIQNPGFPFPGLYSVHATLKIDTDGRLLSLRSNDQLVTVGDSRNIPKSSYGQLERVDADTKTATLNLGSLQQVRAGDEFKIQTSTIHFWKLTITEVASNYSIGRFEILPLVIPAIPTNLDSRTLESVTNELTYQANWKPTIPKEKMGATLILKGVNP